MIINEKTYNILKYCIHSPARYTELRNVSGMSESGLAYKLNKLIAFGLLEKLSDGRYALTDEGREVVYEFMIMELIEDLIEKHGAVTVYNLVKKLYDETGGL